MYICPTVNYLAELPGVFVLPLNFTCIKFSPGLYTTEHILQNLTLSSKGTPENTVQNNLVFYSILTWQPVCQLIRVTWTSYQGFFSSGFPTFNL